MRPLIGFGQSSGVGKDTACEAIVRQLFSRGMLRPVHLKFSAGIKKVAHDLFGLHGLMPGAFYEEPGKRRLRQVRLAAIGKTPEELWIEIGSKLREVYEPVWSDQGLQLVHNGPGDGRLYLFSDVRSLIEARAIRDAGGLLVKITRPDQRVLALDTLIPEDYAWDTVLVNDGPPEKLEAAAVELAWNYMTTTLKLDLEAGPRGK